jgi:hypothetical protein
MGGGLAHLACVDTGLHRVIALCGLLGSQQAEEPITLNGHQDSRHTKGCCLTACGKCMLHCCHVECHCLMASQSQRAVLSRCCRWWRAAAVVGMHGPGIVLRIPSDAWLELTHIAVVAVVMLQPWWVACPV